MANTVDCRYVEESDLATQYLAGKLSENDAEAFEKHYLACERCWKDVRMQSELRAALGKPVLASAPATARQTSVARDTWTLLAAAAAVAMVALGIRQLAGRPEAAPEPQVLRGEKTASLDLSVRAGSAGQLILEWPPDPDARTYRIKIVRSDGLPILKSETADTRVELKAGALPAHPAGVSFLAKIQALDAMNGVVAESGLKPLPVP